MFVFFCCELSLIALLLRSEEKNDREERWKKRQQNTWPWSNFHIWIFHCAMPLRQCVFIAFLLTVQENVPLQFVWICGTSITFGHPIRRFFFLFSSIAWCQVLCSHCASQPIVNLQLHSDWISRLFHFWRRRMRRVEDRAHCISMRTRIRCVKKKKKLWIKWYNPRFSNIREFRYVPFNLKLLPPARPRYVCVWMNRQLVGPIATNKEMENPYEFESKWIFTISMHSSVDSSDINSMTFCPLLGS